MASSRSIQAARTIWLSADLPERFLAHLILNGEETSIKSSFRVTAAAQAAVGLSALSAAHFHTLRVGVEQSVSVNARHAVLSFSKLSRKRILKISQILIQLMSFGILWMGNSHKVRFGNRLQGYMRRKMDLFVFIPTFLSR